MAGFGNGSVTLERDVTSETRVRTVIYQTLSHRIKSLLHIAYDVPVTMSGIYRKEAPIERCLEDIDYIDTLPKLQYFGKVSLSLMLANPPLSSAALPGNVLCQYLCSKYVYINVINAYHRYVCGRGLFSSDAARGRSLIVSASSCYSQRQDIFDHKLFCFELSF